MKEVLQSCSRLRSEINNTNCNLADKFAASTDTCKGQHTLALQLVPSVFLMPQDLACNSTVKAMHTRHV